MVIARLIGGLGNQCFQYAVARHIAETTGGELLLDVSEFETYKLHAYSLGHFNVRQKFASADDVSNARLVKERHFHFDPEVLRLTGDVYLHGYWQSEKYFSSIGSIIREELSVKTPLEGDDREVAQLAGACDSVSVHIRRMDYVPNTYQEQLFEPCCREYYDAAVAHLGKSLRDPRFFVFTDDKAWAKENFKLPYPVTFVGHNGPEKNYEDMRLMSLCKHNIIANSSFSWWGAWLNRNPGKIVFAPKKWFTEKARSSPKDIVPEAWIRA